jgi:hypothetical protein
MGPSTEQFFFFSSDVTATTCFGHKTIFMYTHLCESVFRLRNFNIVGFSTVYLTALRVSVIRPSVIVRLVIIRLVVTTLVQPTIYN